MSELTLNEDHDHARDGALAAKRHRWRVVLLTLGALVLIVFVVGSLFVSRYKPLEIHQFNYPARQRHLAEPSGTFVLKYVVDIENRGPFPVTLTKIDPVAFNNRSEPSLKTEAFLPSTSTYSDRRPFHLVTLKKNRSVEVAIRVTVPCRPLVAGESLSIESQLVSYDFFGVSHTQSVALGTSVYPATILGPQSCKT
ncbi:MAG TPA: hypothetical protein VND89_07900 [Acidimicrobiales bacterium]|nr:hypothetical protein [Acidimicrobiales bacterium]